jgi:hypothetical protein
VIELLLFLAVLLLAVRWVAGPLRGPHEHALPPDDPAPAAERDALLAAVRDAELDAQTGKLSPEEHRELDARLRAAALAAMTRADRR